MIEIRKMTKDDLDDVVAMEQQIFSTPWSRESFEKAISEESNIYLIAREDEDGTLAGYCGIWVVADEGQINNVCIAQDMRRRHIATKMLKMSMKMAKVIGGRNFTLEVRSSNEAAIKLYEKIGFENCGERKDYYASPKENAVIMWLYEKDKK